MLQYNDIDTLFRAIGLEITKKKVYGPSPGGHKVLVVLQLNNKVDGRTVYVPNVWDFMERSVTFGVVAGARTLVHGNFAFSGDFIRSREED